MPGFMERLEKDGNGWNMTMWGWELGCWKITTYPCLSFLVGSLRNMQHMIELLVSQMKAGMEGGHQEGRKDRRTANIMKSYVLEPLNTLT